MFNEDRYSKIASFLKAESHPSIYLPGKCNLKDHENSMLELRYEFPFLNGKRQQ